MSITYCEQCHGVTGITYSTGVGYQESKEVLPVGPLKFCCGHGPAPAPKHDGWLDKDRCYEVRHSTFMEEHRIDIASGCFDDHIGLTPQAALSLLSWLQQERGTLERLAGGEA
jgi:hypothetical protein